MAQPVGRSLRPARRSGLTSPDPVSHLTPARARRPQYPLPRTPDKPQNRQRRENHALQSHHRRERLHEISRWIEAKTVKIYRGLLRCHIAPYLSAVTVGEMTLARVRR